MNLQEFNNLKVGDKVVVARVVNPYSRRYLGDMNPELYIGKQGVVEDCYLIGEGGIEVLFEEGISWYFNIEDIDLITEKETDMQKTKTPHKHAAIIKAWADGEEIEVKINDQWHGLTATGPSWACADYRIKPKFEKRWQYAYKTTIGDPEITKEYFSDVQWSQLSPHIFKSQKLLFTEKEFQIN